MKKLFSICLALALSLPLLAWTQYGSQQSSNDQNQPNAQGQSSQQPSAQSQSSQQSPDMSQDQGGKHKKGKSKKMSGTVSNNGKTFTNDQDSKSYTVDNPTALQAQEGQHVNVIVAVDPDTNTVHIIQVASPGTPQ